MNISSTRLSALSQIATTSPVSRSSRTAETSETSEGSSATKLSKLGDLMSKLQDLEDSDPDKAKQVLSSIASQLSDKAGSTSDPRLAELADKFTAAAKTGDLSGLRPSGPPPGGRGGPPPGQPPPASSSDSVDPTASTRSGATTTGRLAKYAEHRSNPMQDLESIVSDALSSAAS